MTTEKVIIIGSGPAGYSAAIYCARSNYSPLVFGGISTISQLSASSEVENYPGFAEGLSGPELSDVMQEQAERFGARFAYEDIVKVDFLTKPYKVFTESKTYLADSIIIATGAAPRKMNLDKEEEFSGKGVSYCATCDGFFFKDKIISVAGGGDSAFEEALFLSRFGKEVNIIHRREGFRAKAIMIERAQNNPKINIITNTVIQELHGKEGSLSDLTLKNTQTGETSKIETHGLFVAIGHIPNTSFLKEHLEMDSEGYIKTHDYVKTSKSGIFAAGDCFDKLYRQVATSVGFGCMAALEVEKYLSELE